jgi:rhodanese-related sulfurtransferase
MNPYASTLTAGLLSVALAGLAIAETDDAINRFTATDAAALVDGGAAVLVDVRGPDERDLGHVVDDIHLPLHEVAERLHDLPADRIVICYCDCAGEETSLSVAESLLDIGFDRVGVLVGGYDAWVALGREVVAERTMAEVLRLDVPPIGWIKSRAADAFRFEHRTGALVIRGEGAGAVGERAAAMQELDALALRGREITFEIDLAIRDVAFGVSIWIRGVGEDERVVGYAGLEPGPAVGTAAFVRYRVSMVVPDTARTIDFGVVLGGTGEVIADDASLTFAADGSSVPGTVNLDFER